MGEATKAHHSLPQLRPNHHRATATTLPSTTTETPPLTSNTTGQYHSNQLRHPANKLFNQHRPNHNSTSYHHHNSPSNTSWRAKPPYKPPPPFLNQSKYPLQLHHRTWIHQPQRSILGQHRSPRPLPLSHRIGSSTTEAPGCVTLSHQISSLIQLNHWSTTINCADLPHIFSLSSPYHRPTSVKSNSCRSPAKPINHSWASTTFCDTSIFNFHSIHSCYTASHINSELVDAPIDWKPENHCNRFFVNE